MLKNKMSSSKHKLLIHIGRYIQFKLCKIKVIGMSHFLKVINSHRPDYIFPFSFPLSSLSSKIDS